MKPAKVTLVPLVVAAAAFFVLLPRTGGDAEIRMVEADGTYRFAPANLSIELGDRIRVENTSDTTHTITASGAGIEFGDLQPGQNRFLEVSDRGTIEFSCRYHAADGMIGTLTVT